MTVVNITFTGLCMFRKESNSVVVRLPDAANPVRHCRYDLRPHAGLVIVEAKYLEPGGGSAPTMVAFPVRDLVVDAGTSAPALPSHLASVAALGKVQPGQHPAGHVLATVELLGGSFVPPNPPINPLSGDWDDGSGVLKQFRWLANWSGTISASEITLGKGTEKIVLRSVGGPIDLAIVNVMPADLVEWLKQGPPSSPSPLPGTEAIDFRWFFWMHNLQSDANHCGSHCVPVFAGPHATGLPYTCLLGGE